VPLAVLLLVGISMLVQALGGTDAPTSADLFHRLLPRHPIGGTDPFRRIEDVLVSVTQVKGEASLVAAPTFVWLSMRVFAAVRIALNTVFEHVDPPRKVAAQLLGFVRAKLRDAAMVVLTVSLFLANTALTAGIRLAETVGSARVPALAMVVSGAGRLLLEALGIVFSVLPFWLIYRFASSRKIRAWPALVAACVTALGFEVAKRAYGVYLGQARTLETVARGDADLLAGLLFVLWVHMTGLVFLVGGALAHSLQESVALVRKR
jgi:membrane protein